MLQIIHHRDNQCVSSNYHTKNRSRHHRSPLFRTIMQEDGRRKKKIRAFRPAYTANDEYSSGETSFLCLIAPCSGGFPRPRNAHGFAGGWSTRRPCETRSVDLHASENCALSANFPLGKLPFCN